ncbi:regulatory protein, luxR family [Caenispirillum bisanense]|uniref:Regulatory protein, luxR family n=2 Tax=Caenispirillum bisanense TaxID=414052 RepID=A0A286G681_9PROT|nr:regulatory protein, luxR family [Caenispirillum bisanense]
MQQMANWMSSMAERDDIRKAAGAAENGKGWPRALLCLVAREDLGVLGELVADVKHAPLYFLDRPADLLTARREGSVLIASASRVANEPWSNAIGQARRTGSLPTVFLTRSDQMIEIAPYADLIDNLIFLEVPPRRLGRALTMALDGFVTLPGRARASLAVDAVRQERLQRLDDLEQEVIALIAEGMTNEQIARRLGMGEPQVKRTVKRILDHLGLRNRTEAAVFYHCADGGLRGQAGDGGGSGSESPPGAPG